MMNRRKFIYLSGVAGIGSYAGYPFRFPKNPMDRIGMSTVTFRQRFEQTRDEDLPQTSSLTLLESPAFFQDRFGVRNIEFWSEHFESTDPAYLKELKKQVRDHDCNLINIQCGEEYDISDSDDKARKESVDLVLKWVGIAADLGSPAIRVNPGEDQLELAVQSYKTINEAVQKKGMILMIENHFGLATDPDDLIRMIQEIGGGNVYSLPDYGNYPNDEFRFAALEKILPYAYQISAKATDFNEQGEHVGFDFERCMAIAEDAGFKGIYSVEQWSGEPNSMPDDAMGDRLIEQVKNFLST